MQKDFLVGEEKYVDIHVSSVDGSAFVITSATYKLLDWNKKEVETGNAYINDHNISVLIDAPILTGRYELIIFYTVPPETRGVKVILNVS